MLNYGLFQGSCILAVYFACITHNVVQHASIGILLVVVTHAIPYYTKHWFKWENFTTLSHSVLALLAEMSLFLILCSSIGQRSSQRSHIAVEYAYIPLLLVTLNLYGRYAGKSTLRGNIWLKLNTTVAFVYIVCIAQPPHLAYAGDTVAITAIFCMLVCVYATPEREVVAHTPSLIFSIISKSIVLTISILSMNTRPLLDASKHYNVHEFYMIRAAVHHDPQFDDAEMFSIRGFMAHFTKFIYLVQTCIRYEKVLQLDMWTSNVHGMYNSKHEVVLICIISTILICMLGTYRHGSRQVSVCSSLRSP
jgi:hypothetical protein